MQSLQTIQQLHPAAAISIMLALPWVAATLMHAFSTGVKAARGEQWNQKAGAAVRWSNTIARLARTGSTTILNFPARPSAPRYAPAAVTMQRNYPHAA
jgi:hypothetical protein